MTPLGTVTIGAAPLTGGALATVQLNVNAELGIAVPSAVVTAAPSVTCSVVVPWLPATGDWVGVTASGGWFS